MLALAREERACEDLCVAERELECDIAIVGAGAAGLWAAGRAARAGRRVILFEKTARTGTKVLASGGTHCNLTTTLPGREAARLFGREGARFLETAFRVLSPLALRERFAELGVETVEAPLEKIFPASGRARDVRDALEREVRAAGASIVCEAELATLERAHEHWILHFQGGRSARAGRVILCPGGKSYPRTGTTGDGYVWLKELGLEQVEPVPALVPLSSPASWVRELTGIALPDVEARILDSAGKVLGSRRRPVLFTHRGVSGPGAMDLSVHVARARGATCTLALDLVPELTREALRERCIALAGAGGTPGFSRVLPESLPKRVVHALARQAGLGGGAIDPRLNTLARAQRDRLIESAKGLAIPIDGTLGFDLAEVTAGGLALGELDPGTLRVRKHPGLYVCGELLDLQGPIGGLNFQAAFSTAELAARDAVRDVAGDAGR